MGAKEIIVALLVVIFVGFAVAFGLWSSKGDEDGVKRDSQGK